MAANEAELEAPLYSTTEAQADAEASQGPTLEMAAQGAQQEVAPETSLAVLTADTAALASDLKNSDDKEPFYSVGGKYASEVAHISTICSVITVAMCATSEWR